jgi:hypothetical protein
MLGKELRFASSVAPRPFAPPADPENAHMVPEE